MMKFWKDKNLNFDYYQLYNVGLKNKTNKI